MTQRDTTTETGSSEKKPASPSRRQLLGANVFRTAAAGTLASAALLSRRAKADNGGAPITSPVVLQLFLRGGACGLSKVVPYADPDYCQKRTRTRVFPPTGFTYPMGHPCEGEPAPPLLHRATDIPVVTPGAPLFGIPLAMNPLLSKITGGQVAFIHACGSLDPTRSHFEQQLKMEQGVVGTGPDATGWLGRFLELTKNTTGHLGPLRAYSFSANPLDSFDGGEKMTSAPDPVSFEFPEASWMPVQTAAGTLESLYNNLNGGMDPLTTSFTNDKNAIAEMVGIPFPDCQAANPTNCAGYTSSKLGGELSKAAALAKCIPGLEVLAVNYDNIDGQRWDTHADQGVHEDIDGGAMYNLMTNLSVNLNAFLDDMAASGRPAIVLVITEFGRRLQENASNGTDHGRGGVAMVCASEPGIVNAGVHAPNWPGLDSSSLFEQLDLDAVVDLRDIMTEVALKFMGLPASHVSTTPGSEFNDLFPDQADDGFAYQDYGILA